MNPKKFDVKMANAVQYATLGQMVAIAVTKALDGKLTFDQAQTAITDVEQVDVKKIAVEVASQIFSIPIDPWFEEKRKISHFYKTCFTDNKWKNPNWEQVTIPSNKGKEYLKRPEFIFIETMTEDDALDAYALRFGKDNVWTAWNEKLAKVIDRGTIQPRPAKNYAMLHVGGDEPDLLNKSYDDGVAEAIPFMTPLEGIISTFRYRFETGNMYDVKGITRLSALDCNGDAVSMGRGSHGLFSIDGHSRDFRYPDYGLRQVSF
jgi:hypothetical protein